MLYSHSQLTGYFVQLFIRAIYGRYSAYELRDNLGYLILKIFPFRGIYDTYFFTLEDPLVWDIIPVGQKFLRSAREYDIQSIRDKWVLEFRITSLLEYRK